MGQAAAMGLTIECCDMWRLTHTNKFLQPSLTNNIRPYEECSSGFTQSDNELRFYSHYTPVNVFASAVLIEAPIRTANTRLWFLPILLRNPTVHQINPENLLLERLFVNIEPFTESALDSSIIVVKEVTVLPRAPFTGLPPSLGRHLGNNHERRLCSTEYHWNNTPGRFGVILSHAISTGADFR